MDMQRVHIAVCDVAMVHLTTPAVTAGCVFFFELAGEGNWAQRLRDDLEAATRIHRYEAARFGLARR